MEKFRITALVTVSTYTDIEANSEEEALRIAEERTDMMSFVSNNADTPEDVWMVEELDGTPYNFNIEK